MSSGRFGGAFVYAPPQRFAAAAAPSLDLLGAVTISAWFYPTDLSVNDYHALVSKLTIAPERSNYWLGHDEDRFVVTFHDAADWHNHATAATHQPDRWYHLVAVIDTANDQIRLYVDGVLAIDVAETAEMTTDAGSLWVGWSPGDLGVTGVVDEVALWNRALSGAEVLSLYP